MADSNIYEWDDEKDAANQRKHQVSFEMAKSAFGDPHALARLDEKHSTQTETRHTLIGICLDGRVLTVVFTKRTEKLRIISAQVRRKEQRVYEKQKKAARK